ncbi:hypothetical protein [Brevibacterium linens]|uniref:Uncharacterized protein n=1 Tax=Brevibacterium linens ATCC 9172 TaxID=1255617 RepID=A0A2H1KDZ1_BRELN|nr:hypothetical protein [Brevibacterium linens]KAB1944931.1 hypothetical protein F8227_14455 [Brevibacterium linens ATCC 9172]SMX97926.1 hypothetical protein BLIN9172_03077 [Brevibacterium linens ATCC 9172]
MSALSRGYRMSSTEAASILSWEIEVTDGVALKSPQFLPDWSYFHPFSATLKLQADIPLLLHTAGVSDDATIGLSLSWSTQKVGRSGVAEVVPIEAREVTSIVQIPRGTVGGNLRLGAKVIMLEPGLASDRFAPNEIGAILWEESIEVRLEGDAPRLPVVIIPDGEPPFSGSSNARWHIWINHEDLTLPVDIAVRINLNQANPAISDMLDGNGGAQGQVLLASLMLDLHRELVRRALLDVDDLESVFFDASETASQSRFPDGSLGSAMESDLLLLGGDIEMLKNQAEFRWAELDVEIQRFLNIEVANG